jgi:D-xylose transport system substrate-binding protein
MTAAQAADIVVGVSWSNFQEERWKTDEAAIKGALEAAGAKYISADAQSLVCQAAFGRRSLIAQGANALIILAQDSQAIGPAVQAAADEGIPVVGYDRLIEDPRAFYLTFDNVEVGRMQARAVLAAQPEGNYVMIKGSPTDPNADFLRGGQQEVLQAAIDGGKVKIVGEAYTDGWLPANAQRNMEQILTANDNKVDAVVASNDGTAGGVVAALTAQGMEGIPVSGQDGDHAALNRVAKGTQTVSVWKDARELGKAAGEIAVALAGGAEWASSMAARQPGPRQAGTELTAKFLAPVPVTKDNLTVVVDAGWISKDELCQGVKTARLPATNKNQNERTGARGRMTGRRLRALPYGRPPAKKRHGLQAGVTQCPIPHCPGRKAPTARNFFAAFSWIRAFWA